MDITFAISAVIFTLLSIVVATFLFKGSSSVVFARGLVGHPGKAGLDPCGPRVPDPKTPPDPRRDPGRTSLDHRGDGDQVLSEESESPQDPAEHTPSRSTSDDSGCMRPSGSRTLDPDAPSAAAAASSSGSGSGSPIGTPPGKELLECGFSYPQTEGATEGPGIDDMKYVPGQARSKHMETLMSKQELEEEQRVQREQLAAIFQLLKENQQTFGEVSEGDLEDQFRLYSL